MVTFARDATAAPCERCGAPLSLSHAGRARCLFCLHDQALPANLVAPLAEHAELAHELETLRGRLERSGRRRGSALVIIAVALFGVVSAAAVSVLGVSSSRDDALELAMFGSLGLLGVLPFVAVPVLWIRVQAHARARVLAALPVSTPVVRSNRITSDCPQCGATHTADAAALTVTCSYCGCSSLLPLPLVDARLAIKHRAVIDARARGDAERDSARAAAAAWQRMIKPLMRGFSVVFLVVVIGFVLAANLR
jgi:ribosomal protein S27E